MTSRKTCVNQTHAPSSRSTTCKHGCVLIRVLLDRAALGPCKAFNKQT